MSRRLLISLVLATGSVLVSSAHADAGLVLHALHAHAAGSPNSAPPPTIKRIHPRRVAIGKTLTIVGNHFLPGKRRNTVVFLRDGAPAVFLKAQNATRKRLTVKLTSKLGRYLVGRNNGEKAPTRFRLRVLSARFGAHFTSGKLVPTILPRTGDDGGGHAGPPAPVCSLESAKLAPGADADHDMLITAQELEIHTDPCVADSDGDGIPDGYEYESALDLNSRALPYPGKRPYPNPLDPSDAGVDYDSDGLLQSDEYAAWVRYGGSHPPLNYSDGTQTTGGPIQVSPSTQWQDMNGDGFLTDDEKDVDGDHLTNWDEAHGRMQPGWWKAIFTVEKPYEVAYLPTDWLDPDTDGDTLKDGPDDVDHDGYPNQDEVERGPYWVQPFNPCLPDYDSLTCALHPPPATDSYPPFGPPGYTPGEPIPLVWPRP
jgi:hypothetical protein